MSEGPDGNVYMVLTPGVIPASCDDRLFAVNKNTGAILIDQAIGKEPSAGGIT
ncbi:MAG: hypothetical protein JWO54_51, partial [Candidatus Saccharibacteria bacterium]|nr:hypothetical protein [Candidatus Saccharibacteria bacterium]